jgi:hypothetical protein
MYDETETLLDQIDTDHLADRLEGRNGGLRKSKPATDADTGLTQYIWRMCRFHAGADTSMPVTAAWWLQEYLDETGIDASVSGILDEEGKEITDALDGVVDEVLAELGYDSDAAAKRWKKAGAF